MAKFLPALADIICSDKPQQTAKIGKPYQFGPQRGGVAPPTQYTAWAAGNSKRLAAPG